RDVADIDVARSCHGILRLDQAGLVERGTNERGEERVRLERLRFELGMELHADEPGMARPLYDLGQLAVGRHAGEAQPLILQPASGRLARWRAASITAICMPKQMPKYGTCRSRAKRAASILPSAPRSPKPPGTRMPWTPSRRWTVSSCSKISESSQSSLTLTL